MPKILFISTIAVFSRFNIPFIQWFKQQGWQVDYASDGEFDIPDADNEFAINIRRNPYDFKNIRAYFQLKNILKNGYNIVHCHTPMGGVLGRLVVKNMRTKPAVIYTAHGFHFYKGAPLLNWILYYPIEKYFARFTDAIITINEEDYFRAQKKLGRCGAIYKIDGVGIDPQRFYRTNIERKLNLRKRYGFKHDNFLLIYVAELNKNKNHIFLLRQVKNIVKKIPNIKILFIGGDTCPAAKNFIKQNNLESFVFCLGYKNDVENYYALSDVCFSSSIREGLGLNIIEGMATGLPIVCSKNRGHNSLITHNHNGLLFDLHDPNQMTAYIFELYSNNSLREYYSNNNLIDSKKYFISHAIDKMANIYRDFM
jgi:glycosyltransferase EpsD